MRAVFADTFYWISLTSPEDKAHSVTAAFDASKQHLALVTTEEVLTEFLTFFGNKGPFLRTKAVAVVRAVLSDKTIHVQPQTHETFRAGFELYAARPDKGYSLTDCISMETMRREGLTEVLTNDHHFEQEGFRPVFHAS